MVQPPEQTEISEKDIKVAKELIKKAKREEYKFLFPNMKPHIEEWERKAFLENDTESAEILDSIIRDKDEKEVFNEAPDVFFMFLLGTAIVQCYLVEQDLEFLSDHARHWVNFFAEDIRMRNALVEKLS